MLHNIQLDDDQLSVLDKALRKGVFEEVAPVISAINLQLTAALKAQQEEAMQLAKAREKEAAE